MSARRATGISYAQGPIWLSSSGSTGVVALDVEQEEGRPPAAAPLEREPVIRGGLERRAPLAAAQQLICPRDEERGRVAGAERDRLPVAARPARWTRGTGDHARHLGEERAQRVGAHAHLPLAGVLLRARPAAHHRRAGTRTASCAGAPGRSRSRARAAVTGRERTVLTLASSHAEDGPRARPAKPEERQFPVRESPTHIRRSADGERVPPPLGFAARSW